MKCMKGNNNLLQLGRYVPLSTVSCRNLQLRLLQHHSVLFIKVVNYMQLITQELFAYLCYPWLILRDSPCLARAHLIEKSYFEPIVCFWNCRQFWNWNSKKNWFREIKKIPLFMKMSTRHRPHPPFWKILIDWRSPYLPLQQNFFIILSKTRTLPLTSSLSLSLSSLQSTITPSLYQYLTKHYDSLSLSLNPYKALFLSHTMFYKALPLFHKVPYKALFLSFSTHNALQSTITLFLSLSLSLTPFPIKNYL